MAKTFGADVVGMSLASESIIVNYLDMKISALSIVGNMASGINDTSPKHEDVLTNVDKNSNNIIKLLKAYINQ